MPAYAGTAVIDETPGTTSNGIPAFAHAGRLLGAGGVEERVAVEQPDDAAAALRGLHDEPGTHGVAQRLAVVAERAVDDLDVVAAEPPDERPRPATR